MDDGRIFCAPILVRLCPAFCLYSKDALGTNNDVINIKFLSRKIMIDLVAVKHKLIKLLTDNQLTVNPNLKLFL